MQRCRLDCRRPNASEGAQSGRQTQAAKQCKQLIFVRQLHKNARPSPRVSGRQRTKCDFCTKQTTTENDTCSSILLLARTNSTEFFLYLRRSQRQPYIVRKEASRDKVEKLIVCRLLYNIIRSFLINKHIIAGFCFRNMSADGLGVRWQAQTFQKPIDNFSSSPALLRSFIPCAGRPGSVAGRALCGEGWQLCAMTTTPRASYCLETQPKFVPSSILLWPSTFFAGQHSNEICAQCTKNTQQNAPPKMAEIYIRHR